jgi:alginate O-acetyltransferase complex protein AlgI
MLFNSQIFLFFFLPITYLVFWSLRTKRARYICLAVTGYIFYGYWNPKFCLLMLFSTLVSYAAGRGFLKYPEDPKKRKLLLIVPITVDLLLLAFFKYADFGINTANWFLGLGGAKPLPLLHILLPVGISFYTFHTITYIVDSYRKDVQPTKDFFEFACYVSLFSQLVAGPIVRFRELQQDLETIDQKDRAEGRELGWSFFVIGMAQKVLLADSIAAIIDPGFHKVASLSSLSAWLCMLGYTYQIYFDFAGYSNMAVGLGHLFGMHIPQNFNSPYQSLNPSDFWRRWHISLSRCLRDYLYIAMGGNRSGEAKTYRNLMLTMLFGGLWHGASWNFVIWGGYHGLLLALHRKWGKGWDALPPWFQRGMMFLLVIFSWVVFRAETWADARTLFSLMLLPHSGILLGSSRPLMALLLLAAGIAHFGRNTFEISHRWSPLQVAGLTALFVGCLVAIFGGQMSPFLYFQF